MTLGTLSKMSVKPRMQPVQLIPEQPSYPQNLRLRKVQPTLTAIGNLEILRHQTLGLVASTQCPDVVQSALLNQLQTELPDDITLISGFHSPCEQTCLISRLANGRPTVRCLAHGLAKPALSTSEYQAIERGHYLLLSCFSATIKRADVKRAAQRNRFVVAIADQVLIPYAAPGSKTEALAKTVVDLNKALLTLSRPETQNLVEFGAVLFNASLIK